MDKDAEKIASQLNIAVSTVGSIVRKWKATGGVVNSIARSGRSRKLNDCNDRYVARMVKKILFLLGLKFRRLYKNMALR